MYDAIIVGARCAGSPTGMLLARAGLKVLVVDRDTFPSDTISTAYMQLDAVVRMQKWGLLQRLVDSGAPQIQFIDMALGPAEMKVPLPTFTFAPRRTVLDKLLVDAARESGAEVRESCSVQEVLRDASGAVAGVRLQQQGTVSEESASIVIGADGRNSVVARSVGPQEYDFHEGTTTGYYSFFQGNFDLTTAMLRLRANHGLFAFPTHDDSMCIAFEGRAEKLEEMRSDPGAYMFRLFDEHARDMAAKVRASKQTERWLGISKRPSFYRKPYGPGWALVGDAGFLKDPLLGDGINDAFRDAELLVDAILGARSGEATLEEGMTRYESARNAATKERFDLGIDLTQFGDMTPELIQRFGGSSQSLAQQAAAASAAG